MKSIEQLALEQGAKVTNGSYWKNVSGLTLTQLEAICKAYHDQQVMNEPIYHGGD